MSLPAEVCPCILLRTALLVRSRDHVMYELVAAQETSSKHGMKLTRLVSLCLGRLSLGISDLQKGS